MVTEQDVIDAKTEIDKPTAGDIVKAVFYAITDEISKDEGVTKLWAVVRRSDTAWVQLIIEAEQKRGYEELTVGSHQVDGTLMITLGRAFQKSKGVFGMTDKHHNFEYDPRSPKFSPQKIIDQIRRYYV